MTLPAPLRVFPPRWGDHASGPAKPVPRRALGGAIALAERVPQRVLGVLIAAALLTGCAGATITLSEGNDIGAVEA